jgi:sugar phosphate isomerase/epimerase
MLAVASAYAKPDFILSVQAWTFNRFTLYEAIEKTEQAGAKYIEMYPGQTLRPGSDVKVGPEMPAEETENLIKFLNDHCVTPVAFGVTGVPKEEDQARPLFAWAKHMGLMVMEFDIKVGFHNHPKQPNNPNYKMWDPAYVYSVVKDRDHRIGSCADIGHWVRSGIKPVDAIKTLHGRIVSSHLKDLNEFSPDGHDVPFGTGVSDMKAVLDTFGKIGFGGPASIEYEYNWDNSVIDVASCVGFVRGYMKK